MLDFFTSLREDLAEQEARVVGFERGSLVVTLAVGASLALFLSKVARHCIATARQQKMLQAVSARVGRLEAGSRLSIQLAEFARAFHAEYADQLIAELHLKPDPEVRSRLIHEMTELSLMIEKNVKFLDAPADPSTEKLFPDEATYKEIAASESAQLPPGTESSPEH